MPATNDFSNLPSWLTGQLQSGGVTVPTAPTGPTRSAAGSWGSLLDSMSGRAGIDYINQQNQKKANPGTDVTGQAVSNNLASGPDLASLTNLINQLNLQAQQQSNAGRIPGGPALEQQSSTNIGSLLGGNIPQDVITQLAQQAAERGVAMGSPGSDNANSSLLRSLGLTSLDLQQLGQKNLTAALARNPGAPLFDPTSQLITPYQQGTLNNQANQLALEWYRALHPQLGYSGGGRGGQQPQQPSQPDMSWFTRALGSAGALNQPVGAPNVLAPPASTYNPNFDVAGVDVPTFDTVGTGYNYNPSDVSAVDVPSFDTAGANYDPFAEYDFASMIGG